MTELSPLAEAIAACREKDVMDSVRNMLQAGTPATDIIAQCNRGMIELGDRFNRNECFLPDLMVGGMIVKGVMAELAPHLPKAAPATQQVPGYPVAGRAKAVIGTAQYDVHDIGKDIVVMLLRGAGFVVVDLGVDVPPQKFVDAVRQHQPSLLGLSILLTTCFKSVVGTVEAIRQAGLRDGLSIMVGGAAASDLLRQKAGCDFYGKTAVDGLKYARQVAGVD